MNYRPLLIICLSLPLAATQFGNGCVSDDGGGTGSSGTSGGAGTGTSTDGRLPGDRGQIEIPRRLPRNSDLVREGHEKQRWTADLDGTVYVYDVDADRIAWTGPVRRGQEVYVDPKRDGIMVGDKVVYQGELSRDALHRIYFSTTPSQRDRGDVIGRDRDDDDEIVGPRERPSRDPAGDIPTAARPLADGRGSLEVRRAPADGTIYVYDADTRRIMLKRTVRQGDSFQIVPTEDYIAENGKRTGTLRLDADHRHVLYFKATPR